MFIATMWAVAFGVTIGVSAFRSKTPLMYDFREKEEEASQLTSNNIIATFTVILALLTAAQWRTHVATLTSNRRESRAYVSINAHTTFVKQNTPVVRIRLINFGQTPAMKAEARLDVIVRDEKIGTDFEVPPIKNGWAPEGIVFPNADQNSSVQMMVTQSATKALTPTDVQDLVAGIKFMYILGEVRYDDVFGARQHSTCCFGIEAPPIAYASWLKGEDDASFGLTLKSAPMGNTAT